MKKSKGRNTLEQLIPLSEAARMLRVCHKTIHNMCRRGLLDPTYLTGKGEKHFSSHEIAALAEVMHQKVTAMDAIALATRAYVIAKANETRIEEAFRLLGLKRKTLSTEEIDVISLYEQARHHLTFERQPTFEELEEWSPTFFAIDEAYMRLIERHAADPEPWRVFLDLANKMVDEQPLAFFELMPELKQAYRYLNAARSHLRTAAYFYCRERKGVAVANALFGSEDVTDRLLGIVSTS